MTTLKNSKPAMAEVLVRQVLGESAGFERICDQRGVSLVDAVNQALRTWMNGGLSLVRSPIDGEAPALLLPDPNECPQGQEMMWLEVCEHDLEVLRQEQQRCIDSRDATGLNRTNRSIEAYIQAVAGLRERVA